jgi:N-acetylglucosamine kinase-like BadF-type ATPase
MHVMGIDAGATKTVCLLADEDGRILAEAKGPGANLAVDGELAVEKVLHSVMDQAGGEMAEPAVICLGMAGVDRPDDGLMARSIMRRIASRSRSLVVNDAMLALVAGVGDKPGVVVVAGTGAIVYGRNAANYAARAAGWGHLLDDEGSGYWIGLSALKAVMRQSDRRGPRTQLTELILAHFGVRNPSDLVHVVYYRNLSRREIAALGVLVEQASASADEVACGILERAASELLRAAASVTMSLGMSGEAFSYVLAGGAFKWVPSLETALSRTLANVAPLSSTITLDTEPAAGAVYLAAAELGGRLVLPSYIPDAT